MNRTKAKKRILVGFCAVFMTAGSAFGEDQSQGAEPAKCSNSGDAKEIDAILAQRNIFNAAIRSLDIEAIADVLVEDVLLITGTGSDVYQGREVQLNIWRGDADDRNRAIYVRKPTCVQASPIFPIAMEYGRWRGGNSHEAASFASGSYTAKWRKTDDTWRLEVETYMTTRCGGSFCPKTEAKP